MANARGERDSARERQAIRERQVRVYLGAALILVAVVVYFVVPTVAQFAGRRFDQPDWRAVAVLVAAGLVMMGLMRVADVVAIVKGLRITYVQPKREGGHDAASDDGGAGG